MPKELGATVSDSLDEEDADKLPSPEGKKGQKKSAEQLAEEYKAEAKRKTEEINELKKGIKNGDIPTKVDIEKARVRIVNYKQSVLDAHL